MIYTTTQQVFNTKTTKYPIEFQELSRIEEREAIAEFDYVTSIEKSLIKEQEQKNIKAVTIE